MTREFRKNSKLTAKQQEFVKEEVEDADSLIENLRESSNAVYSSMKEISERTQETVFSVQEQSKMTEMINSAISETAENAKIMVDNA